MDIWDFIFYCSLIANAAYGYELMNLKHRINNSKSGYLVVVHTWFIDSSGWYEFRLYNHTKEDAELFALKMEKKLRNSFCHTSSMVFPIF